jgi:phosphoglycolate phosphatase-like HAD superfamily hydrolase
MEPVQAVSTLIEHRVLTLSAVLSSLRAANDQASGTGNVAALDLAKATFCAALRSRSVNLKGVQMPRAAIFDIDGTLVDSVDLHARAWHEALVKFGHQVTFEQARSQIGKGGDQLIPVFLSEAEQKDHGEAMEEWRGKLFKSKYLPLVRPFSAVPELLRRVHDAGLKVAVASSAKTSELEVYLNIACIEDLVDVATSSDDTEQSKPFPDIFHVALKKLGIEGREAVAIGDTPYDVEAARKAGIPTIGVLCGGFTEADLRRGGCVAVYPGPGALLACFGATLLAHSLVMAVTPQED